MTANTISTGSHLDALRLRLSHERVRLASATTQSERDLRKVWIAQIEKEIGSEAAFEQDAPMSDDELLATLNG